MDELTLLSLFLGFLLIVSTATIIKTIRAYYVFKASFYTEIYSGFFEFLVRKGNLKRMAHSYWLENELGEHSLMFQVTKTNQKDILQPYILVLLTTGLYVVQLHNETAHYIWKKNCLKSVDQEQSIHLLPNPISELLEFQKHFSELIGKQDLKMHPIVVFSNTSQLTIDKNNVPFICKRELFETIKKQHDAHQNILTNEDIKSIYTQFYKVYH